jgi:hypothetical protein
MQCTAQTHLLLLTHYRCCHHSLLQLQLELTLSGKKAGRHSNTGFIALQQVQAAAAAAAVDMFIESPSSPACSSNDGHRSCIPWAAALEAMHAG